MTESPDVRIGDAEREKALQALGEHMSAGRLDVNEYGDRSAKVAAARTRRELTDLFTDLPQPHPQLNEQWATVEPTTPQQPLTWADRPVHQRLVAALIPLLFAGAVIIGLTTHMWYFMAVPFIVGAMGKGLWGREWEQQQKGNRDLHRQRRRELRDR